MCGIHLIIAKKPTSNNIQQALNRMMAISAYRGPDAVQVQHWQDADQQIWLGGQRLKITDLNDRANQPMISPDERYALLYNGELYNFSELRNQLLNRGEVFYTQSDTEVVLKLLIRQGPSALEEFEGMFALAFYDRLEQKLLLARDSFGIKPLYYTENDQYFLVSSSSRSIITSSLVASEIDPTQINHYLYFRYPQKTRTLYREVRALSEGSYLTYAPSQPTQTKSYQLPPIPTKTSLPNDIEIINTVEELLTDALLRHIATDVPTGLFLSGGVDSTLLLALAKKSGIPPFPTFSIVNDAKEKNFGTKDFRYSRLAAEKYGSYHQEISVNHSTFEAHFHDFIQRMDQPVGDSGAMMTYLLSQEASQHVKVVLSGAGADELFGGYNRHGAYYHYLKNYRLLTTLGKVSKKIALLLPTGFPHPLRKTFRLAKKYTYSLSSDPAATFTNFIGLPTLQSQIPQLPPIDTVQVTDSNFLEHYLSFALEYDQHHYLIEDVLQISDMGSMAHSLELRVPYLDAPLVQYARPLPSEFRLQRGNKWILRQLLNQLGGQAFARRAKEGFGLPFGHWLRVNNSSIIKQYLEDPQQSLYQFFPYDRTQYLLRNHRNGRNDYSAELWSVMLLSAWLATELS